MTARRSSYQIRPPPKEVFPESTLSPGGLQLTTLFWDMGILFHQGSHAGARVGNNFEVFVCITTRVFISLSLRLRRLAHANGGLRSLQT
jgi:hypothetical protein